MNDLLIDEYEMHNGRYIDCLKRLVFIIAAHLIQWHVIYETLIPLYTGNVVS